MNDDASLAKARRALVEAASQWACGFVNATVVVDTATDALVAGLDTPNLRVHAGVPTSDAAIDVPDLIERVMDELQLPYFGPGHPTSRLLAAAALAAEHAHGRLAARDLCRIIHLNCGHDAHPLIEPLAELDDCYDTLEYSRNPTEQHLERRALEAARNLVAAADELFTAHSTAPADSRNEPDARHFRRNEPLA